MSELTDIIGKYAGQLPEGNLREFEKVANERNLSGKQADKVLKKMLHQYTKPITPEQKTPSKETPKINKTEIQHYVIEEIEDRTGHLATKSELEEATKKIITPDNLKDLLKKYVPDVPSRDELERKIAQAAPQINDIIAQLNQGDIIDAVTTRTTGIFKQKIEQLVTKEQEDFEKRLANEGFMTVKEFQTYSAETQGAIGRLEDIRQQLAEELNQARNVLTQEGEGNLQRGEYLLQKVENMHTAITKVRDTVLEAAKNQTANYQAALMDSMVKLNEQRREDIKKTQEQADKTKEDLEIYITEEKEEAKTQRIAAERAAERAEQSNKRIRQEVDSKLRVEGVARGLGYKALALAATALIGIGGGIGYRIASMFYSKPDTKARKIYFDHNNRPDDAIYVNGKLQKIVKDNGEVIPAYPGLQEKLENTKYDFPDKEFLLITR